MIYLIIFYKNHWVYNFSFSFLSFNLLLIQEIISLFFLLLLQSRLLDKFIIFLFSFFWRNIELNIYIIVILLFWNFWHLFNIIKNVLSSSINLLLLVFIFIIVFFLFIDLQTRKTIILLESKTWLESWKLIYLLILKKEFLILLIHLNCELDNHSEKIIWI